MRTQNPSQFLGLTPIIRSMLTHEWQSSAIIAAQIPFPPDAVARRIESQRLWTKKGNTVPAIKSMIVGQAMRNLVAAGFAEKRYVNGKKCEYRLAKSEVSQS